MRTLFLLACSIIASAAIAASALAADPPNGVLSVDRGHGSVTLEIRGVVLGRVASGSVRVTDNTPRDRFVEYVSGKDWTAERVGPRTVVYKGQGLRFRMVGGRYRIVVRGSGIALSAHGRGAVTLDGERRAGEATGLYSVTGDDCSIEPTLCTALPDEPERYVLGTPEESDARSG
jgi:hypothetical protein